MVGMAGGIGIDDEQPVHALVDMTRQRQRVAMIEMAAEGLGVEFVDELLSRTDQAGAGNAIHPGGVDAVEMHRMRMRSIVPEDDAAAARLPSRAAPGPGTRPLKVQAGNMTPGAISISLSSAVTSKVRSRAAVRHGRDGSGLPIGQHRGRIEAVAGVVDLADRDHRAMCGAVAGLAGAIGVGRASLMAGVPGLAGRSSTGERRARRPRAGPRRESPGRAGSKESQRRMDMLRLALSIKKSTMP